MCRLRKNIFKIQAEKDLYMPGLSKKKKIRKTRTGGIKMARGEFGKAFSQHRKSGGTLTQKEFAEEFKKRKGTKPTQPKEEAVKEKIKYEETDDEETFQEKTERLEEEREEEESNKKKTPQL